MPAYLKGNRIRNALNTRVEQKFVHSTSYANQRNYINMILYVQLPRKEKNKNKKNQTKKKCKLRSSLCLICS